MGDPVSKSMLQSMGDPEPRFESMYKYMFLCMRTSFQKYKLFFKSKLEPKPESTAAPVCKSEPTAEPVSKWETKAELAP